MRCELGHLSTADRGLGDRSRRATLTACAPLDAALARLTSCLARIIANGFDLASAYAVAIARGYGFKNRKK